MPEHPSFSPLEFEGDPSLGLPSETESLPLEAKALQRFFGHGLFDEETYRRDHPFGEDAQDLVIRQQKSAAAKGLFEGLRSVPGFHWMMRGLLATSLFFTAGETHSVDATVAPQEQGQKLLDKNAEQTAQDLGVQYELRQLVFEELQEEGRVFTEQDAQFGPESFSPHEVSDYAERLQNLGAMFEYLHRGDPDVIDSYRDPQKRLENYKALAELIGKEFRHTKLLWTFSLETVDMAAEILPHLPKEEAEKLYTQFYGQLLEQVGIHAAYDMSTCLLNILDPAAPLSVSIRESGFADPSIASWFKKSSKNNAYFDQNAGRINIMRRLSPKEASTVYQAISNVKSGSSFIIMVDSAPANGGNPLAGSYYDSKNSHQMVRTPDGEFPYQETVRKKAAAWKYSWITDGSPVRLTPDGRNMEYQDLDGNWYLATGEDAVFFGEQPFKLKERSWVYVVGTHFETGVKEPPRPFVVNDFVIQEEGLPHVATTWEKNDFGPKSIHVLDPRKGGRASFLYHSSPLDEAPSAFLVTSHGCVHMKPEDVELMDRYLTKGSVIRNSSVSRQTETSTLLAQR